MALAERRAAPRAPRGVHERAEPPDVVLGYLQGRIGLQMCTLPTASIVGAALLQTWTRDPFDRLITANAAAAAAVLVTRDRAMRRHYRRALF